MVINPKHKRSARRKIRRQLRAKNPHYPYADPNDSRLPKILIPMIRRTFPELVGPAEIVGVMNVVPAPLEENDL